MLDLWTTLLPLVIAGAVGPVPTVVTGILLRSSFAKAAAWIGGMAAVRVLQGLIFGIVFSEAQSHATPASGDARILTGGLLLALSALFYATALRRAIADEDAAAAPAPRWLARVETMSGLTAFGAGGALVAVSPEKWVFTLGAIGAIADAELGRVMSILTFAAFVGLTLSGSLAVLGFAAAAPERSAAFLERAGSWFERHSRATAIVIGALFGTLFLVKALSALGLV